RDFKGTMRQMLSFMGRFKAHLAVILVFAIGSTEEPKQAENEPKSGFEAVA
ncbi:MAG: hypothetical protein HFF51_10770, partial [Lawsonibacter sp.]|nr:hypothetical protein [Lawsonibacter sp.]